MRSVVKLVAAASLAAPAILSAQTSAPPSATITGIAVDSVRGGYLRGAIIFVSGTNRSGMTDSAGQFKIDSVPAGVRYLEVMHPFLDSLGLVVRSPQKEIAAGSQTTFILSVPSARTIVDAKCAPADLARGPAALFGTVMDADTDAPARDATVSVEWTDYELTSKRLTPLHQRRLGSVKPDGTYRVCGIPADLVTGVVAYRGVDSTSVVPVNFGNGLGVVAFHLPGPGVATGAARAGRRGNAVLNGRVVDPGARPLAGARVALEADDAATTTDNQGKFTLSGLRSGTRSLSVRRLGFEPVEVSVDLSSVAPRDVTVTLSRFVPVLDPVRVSAIRELALSHVGFTERKAAGNGKFYGPDDIALRNPEKLTSLLETAGSLRNAIDAGGHRYVTGRMNGCVSYYVDGHPWFTGQDSDPEMSPDNFLSGAELGAVEVYDELSAPAEFQNYSSRGANCALVVIWTKQKLSH